MKTITKLLVAAMATAIAACGNPLTDADYPGEARFRVHGTLEGQTSAALASPHIGLFWAPGLDATSLNELGEIAPVEAADFPTSFDFALFEAPPSAAMVTAATNPEGTETVQLAMALVFGLDDVDTDTTFGLTETGVEEPDQIFGIAEHYYIVYVDSTAPATSPPVTGTDWMFSNPGDLAEGYNLTYIADYCPWTTFDVIDPDTDVVVDLSEPSHQAPPPPADMIDCEQPPPN